MIAKEYLGRSLLFRRLKNGAHGELVERYAVCLVNEGLARHGTWRCLNLVGGLLRWIAGSRSKLTDLDEHMVERYLRYRGGKQSIQPGDRAALKRWLSVLRDTGSIAPAALLTVTPPEQIFEEFGDYLRRERGLAPKSIVHHQPFIRRFLCEVCPAGVGDLGRISQEDVIHYIERHARDWSAESGKAMCWSLRAFLRYLHHRGLNPLPLAGCVPSIRRWKFASLPARPSRTQGSSPGEAQALRPRQANPLSPQRSLARLPRGAVADQTMPYGTGTLSARWAATARKRRVLPERFGIVQHAA
jgi:hypothetical protein